MSVWVMKKDIHSAYMIWEAARTFKLSGQNTAVQIIRSLTKGVEYRVHMSYRSTL